MISLIDTTVVEEVKSQWKRMWQERFDDHVRAEAIACDGYKELFVDKGTVFFATCNFKVLTLREILELHKIENAERFVPVDPHVGGWGKFVRSNITSGTPRKRPRRREVVLEKEKHLQHLKKGGRGWLHV